MPEVLTHGECCDQLGSELRRFADLLEGADVGTPVKHLSDWTVRSVVEHLGQVHRWATGLVATRAARPVGMSAVPIDPPADPSRLPEWLLDGGDELLAALRGGDPETAMWAWGPVHNIGWWSRRQLHETAIHRADVALALGVPEAFATDLATDGIDEFFGNLMSAAAFSPPLRQLRGDGQQLGFTATDTGRTWHVTLTADGFTATEEPGSEAGAAGRADATVNATASDLYLYLWGRRDAADPVMTATGDAALLAFWTEHSAVG